MANTIVATADYGTIITNTGAAKIAACILNGTKLNITHAAVGDGGGAYYMPTVEQNALVNECWRGEIASYEINKANPNMIDVMFVVPAEVGGFTIREAEIIDSDGDVFAICNTPDAQKVAITDGVSFPVTILMHIIVTDVSVVEITVNPSLDTVDREELDAALEDFANRVGSAVIGEITIPAADWVAVSEEDAAALGNNKYTVDVSFAEALAKHFPVVALDLASLDIAANAVMCPTCEALDGIVRFWAEEIPTADLTGTIALRSENMAYTGGTGGGSTDTSGIEVATNPEVSTEIDESFS